MYGFDTPVVLFRCSLSYAVGSAQYKTESTRVRRKDASFLFFCPVQKNVFKKIVNPKS